MGPRRASDYRTLLWAALMPVVAGAQYVQADLVPYLSPLSCYLALAAGVMAHNHNHCPTFASRRANRVFGVWLSLFYGYPTFAWIPTHNLNHHRYTNGPGDATITWRYSNRRTLFIAATYFFVSSYFQSGPIKSYIRKARLSNRDLYRQILLQYAIWGGVAVGLLALAIARWGVARGLVVWLAASALPAVFALWTIMLFNYEQHVHADPFSEHNHSRSWTSRPLNFLLFNNGFHAAHHENPGLHWSELPRAHALLAPSIAPALVEGSVSWYFFKNYALAPFWPRFGSRQIGSPPFAREERAALDVSTADVPLADAGENVTERGPRGSAPVPASAPAPAPGP
jgi:fatty acid desaturase